MTEVSRRSFLKVGLGGGLVLAVGGIGLSLRPTVMRPPNAPLKALDERSYSILVAIADRIAPGGDGFPAASEIQVAENIDTLMSKRHPDDIAEFEQALMLVENALAGLVFDGRFSTFTGSSPEAQDHALHAFRTSGLHVRRTVYKAIYGLCAGAYWAHQSHYERIGYPGPPDFGSGRGTQPSRPPIQRRSQEPPGPLDTKPVEDTRDEASGETP